MPEPDPLRSLAFAVEKYPERVMALPLDRLVLESARQNPKRPAYLKIAVPDEIVKSLRGPADRRHDVVLLVSIPRQVVERSESRIILPGEMD